MGVSHTEDYPVVSSGPQGMAFYTRYLGSACTNISIPSVSSHTYYIPVGFSEFKLRTIKPSLGPLDSAILILSQSDSYRRGIGD